MGSALDMSRIPTKATELGIQFPHAPSLVFRIHVKEWSKPQHFDRHHQHRPRPVTAAAAASAQLPAHVDLLCSVANAFVKHVVKLRQSSSYRHACGAVAIVGDVPLREICAAAPAKFGRDAFIDCLLVPQNSKVTEGIGEFAKRVVRVTAPVMRKLSGLDSAEGVEAVGIMSLPPSFCSLERTADSLVALSSWCPRPKRLLVLDAIQDPGNLGTLLRTAAAFDWDGVFLLNGCCDPFNEKALRASRGSCFWIPIASGQWNELQAFAAVKEIKLYAGEPKCTTYAMPEGDKSGVSQSFSRSTQELSSWSGKQNLSSLSMSIQHHTFQTLTNIAEEESLCLILGSEGKGLSQVARAACTLISLPMPGRFESLNVAVAGGILLFTLQRYK